MQNIRKSKINAYQLLKTGVKKTPAQLGKALKINYYGQGYVFSAQAGRAAFGLQPALEA
jgi:hypothetical protein